MAFEIRDLAFTLAPDGDALDRGWLVMIGCGPRSVLLHVNTQHRYVRLDAINVVRGVKDRDDLGALRQALAELSADLDLIEASIPRSGGDDGGDDGGDGEDDTTAKGAKKVQQQLKGQRG